jgi:preprotein translocase subunit SecD
MNPNLKWKAVFIVGVILVCFVGLLGLPEFPPKSWADVKSNFANRIKLGLDLQGGTHLILQVQVQEAISRPTTSRPCCGIRPSATMRFAS